MFAKRQGASSLKLAVISFIECLAYRSASAIIHTTQQDVDFVASRYGIARDRLSVIPNWVDTELFKPMDIEKQPRSICFVGRLEPQKNLHALIEALAGLDARLIVYGDGSMRSELEERARELDVYVEFCGRVANEDLPCALNACELFVLPSLYEGHPKVLLEAMACGLPVIGTNVEGIREIIRDGENGVLCGTDAPSIREAITRLFGNTEIQTTLGRAGRAKILATSSLPHAIQAEIPLYRL
jgi:glycosyltransferase involved in cell wall biosynthesis